jgi:hypothetical protein
MKSQESNPAYQRFSHHLSPTGRYPAAYVDVFWNKDSSYKIKDVEVIFIPRGAHDLPRRPDGEEFWNAYSRYNKRWRSDLGNSCRGWLEDDGLTPESIFGMLLEHGFSNNDELERALEEFAHIEECNWARAMLKGFRDE